MANPGILKLLKFTLKITFLLCLLLMCGCSWYSKPAYWGRVVDAETGEPIKGVQVTIQYDVMAQGIVEKGTKSVTTSYLLTDRDGRFEAPPVKTLLGPLSRDFGVVFSVRKGRYASFSAANIAACMSTGCNEIIIKPYHNLEKDIKISTHLIKLPKI